MKTLWKGPIAALSLSVVASLSIFQRFPAHATDNTEALMDYWAAEYETCKFDLDCMADWYQVYADAHCSKFVEKMAPYGFEWTFDIRNPRFGEYEWIDKSKQTLTFKGDRLKIKNEYGGWVDASYECDLSDNGNMDSLDASILDVRLLAPGSD